MFSAVIDMHGEIDGWEFNEPFFYKYRSQKQMELFTCEFSNKKNNITTLADYFSKRVYKFLNLHNISQWQAVFLINIYEGKNGIDLRLSMQLNSIKKYFVEFLKSRRLEPANVIIIAIDSLERDKDNGEPSDEMAKIGWKLDVNGIVTNNNINSFTNIKTGCFFCNDDFDVLNQAWGPRIDLSKEGRLLTHPSHEFLMELKGRVDRVTDVFSSIIKFRRMPGEEGDNGVDGTNKCLDIIESNFINRMENKIKPPLDSDLDLFKPSEIVYKLLRENIGLSAFAEGYKIIRYFVPKRPDHERLTSIVNLAHLLILLSSQNEIIQHIDKEKVYKLEMLINKDELQSFLADYLISLNYAKNQIEELINQIGKPRIPVLEGVGFTCIVEKLDDDVPSKPKIDILNDRAYMDNLENYINEAKHVFRKRETDINDRINKCVNQLYQAKKDKIKYEYQEKEDIKIEIDKVSREIKESYSHLFKRNIEKFAILSKWNDTVKQVSHKRKYLVSTRPEFERMLLTMGVGITLFLMVPYWGSSWLEDNNQFYFASRSLDINSTEKYLAVFAFVLILGITAAFIGRRFVLQPISDFAKEASQKISELLDIQDKSLNNNIKYIEDIYINYTLRQKKLKTLEMADEYNYQNQLIKFHQREIDKHISNCLSLLQKFSKDIESKSYSDSTKVKDFLNKSFNLNLGVEDNLIYSPIYKNLELVNKQVNINIGTVSISDTSEYLQYFNKIILEKDEVYNI